MKDLVSRFNMYDHLAYILVGFYQISILYVLYSILVGQFVENMTVFLKIDYSLVLLLCSYLTGHLVQGLSNVFERGEEQKKDNPAKNLPFVIQGAKRFFGLANSVLDKYVWQYCYLYALSNDFSGHVVLFNSMYSLYRGFWIASLIGLLISGIVVIAQSFFYDWKLVTYMLVFFCMTIVFNRRKKRFFDYLGEKTLITFDILSKDILSKK